MEWKFTEDNPLKVVTLCSGYDSQCMAIRNLGIPYDLVGWSEIDKYAIMAHDAVFPEYKDRNLGDMTKIDWSKVGDFDLLTYSTPCFVAGTLVLTEKGFKPIEDICDNDAVITHTNTYQKVVQPMVRCYEGKLRNIKAMPFDELICTPEHPFYARLKMRVWDNPARRWRRKFENPAWVQARDLTRSHFLGIAINQKSELPNWNGVELHRGTHWDRENSLSALFDNADFWYIMGRYIGDGWKRNDDTHKAIIIAFYKKDKDSLIAALDRLAWNYTITNERTCGKVTIYGREICEFVSRYGEYAHGKRIDAETMNLPIEDLKAFIQGYEDSDGYIQGNVHKISSVSRELIYGIAQCIAKVYHCPYKIYKTIRKRQTVIEGRIVNQRDSYQVYWKLEKGKQDKAFYEDGYIWCPISSFADEKTKTKVYNMEVENDNSYTANGVIVHNCTDFSNAGKQAGGEEGSGTRSSILWWTRYAIIQKKPKYLLMENVKALVSNKFRPLFFKWCRELESYGYVNFIQVLNAKDYGIPQNRERVFVVSIMGDHWYTFPRPQELKLRLKDMLEDRVDEKYYLAQDKVDKFISELPEEKLKMLEDEN